MRSESIDEAMWQSYLGRLLSVIGCGMQVDLEIYRSQIRIGHTNRRFRRFPIG